jgi:hypothetical protein
MAGSNMPTRGAARRSTNRPPSLTAAPATRGQIEILFDQHRYLEQVFAITCLAGTIGVSTSQAEAP